MKPTTEDMAVVSLGDLRVSCSSQVSRGKADRHLVWQEPVSHLGPDVSIFLFCFWHCVDAVPGSRLCRSKPLEPYKPESGDVKGIREFFISSHGPFFTAEHEMDGKGRSRAWRRALQLGTLADLPGQFPKAHDTSHASGASRLHRQPVLMCTDMHVCECLHTHLHIIKNNRINIKSRITFLS